jgi:hypothetical protein
MKFSNIWLVQKHCIFFLHTIMTKYLFITAEGGEEKEIYTIDNDGVLYRCVLNVDDKKNTIVVEKLYKIGLQYGKIGYGAPRSLREFGCKIYDSGLYNETLSTKVQRELLR